MLLKHDSVALLDAAETPQSTATPKKIGFVSLGCPKNLVDSEVMMGLLSQGGAQITPRAEDADIIVVNTCSFIDSAKQESVDAILEMVQHKAQNGGRALRLLCTLPALVNGNNTTKRAAKRTANTRLMNNRAAP